MLNHLMFIGYNQDGKLIVVDSKGEPVDSPPLITKGVDNNGKETYNAYYPGSGVESGVELGAYSTSLEGCFANIGEDGKVSIVDADGNPLKCQPITSKYVDEKGVEQVTAYYPDSGEAGGVELQGYSASLEGCYAYTGDDGKVTIVDADGNPLSCQPITSKYVDEKGVEQVTAYYSGSGTDSGVEVAAYSASLEGCYANIGQDGKITVVDADGNPLGCQPMTSKYVDENGVEQVTAYYSGSGAESSVEVPGYSASLQDCYAHLDQDGSITVVDGEGKPLSSQPVITKYVDAKGNEQISAWYPADQAGTIGTLSWYKPPSGSTSV